MNRKVTLPIEAAQSFAKGSGQPELEAAVAKALDAGWDAVTIRAEEGDEGGYDLIVTEPTGAMVAWFLPDWTANQIAIPGGEPAGDLHITLAYLGEAAELSVDQQRTLIGVVSEVALQHRALPGWLNGIGRFSNQQDVDPFWVGVDIPGLASLRADLVEALATAGIPLKGFGADRDYTPHVTVAYIPADSATPPVKINPLDVQVAELTIALGPARHKVAMLPYDDDDSVPFYDGSAYVPDLVTKSADQIEEDRFTLGPWYVPNQLDAHAEWSDPAELQKALWGYVDNAPRDIMLQHERTIKAGRWVEAVTWPFEVEVPLKQADGTVVKYKYPAGTPFLGVIWEPWAWELIKAGKLRGYSIGGKGDMIEADLPAPA